MATHKELRQAIEEIGNLRESIGAVRANLAALESQLAEKQREVDAAVRTTRTAEKATRHRATTPTPAPPPRVVATAPTPATAGRRRPLKLRRGSLASRIVALLSSAPERNFAIADMARHFNMQVRQLYGTLSRLSQHHLIERVSDGVFRAVRKGGASAAA